VGVAAPLVSSSAVARHRPLHRLVSDTSIGDTVGTLESGGETITLSPSVAMPSDFLTPDGDATPRR
jgi:hypothetical protein